MIQEIEDNKMSRHLLIIILAACTRCFWSTSHTNWLRNNGSTDGATTSSFLILTVNQFDHDFCPHNRVTADYFPYKVKVNRKVFTTLSLHAPSLSDRLGSDDMGTAS